MISRESGYPFASGVFCELKSCSSADLDIGLAATCTDVRGEGAAAPTSIETSASDPIRIADCLRVGLE